MTGMVEKPPAAEAPSDLAIMGRYVLAPEVFDCIGRLQPGAGGELQLTDAMRMLVDDGGAFLGLPFDSGRYDTGNKLDWLRATVEVALAAPGARQGLPRGPDRDRPPRRNRVDPSLSGTVRVRCDRAPCLKASKRTGVR